MGILQHWDIATLERNKIFAAVLIALLIPTLARVVGDHLVHPVTPQSNAYPVSATALADAADAPPVLEAAGIAVVEQPTNSAAMGAAGDPQAGVKVAKKCRACHDFEPGGQAKIGPPLWGIVGAAQAKHPDFTYSGALSQLAGVWNDQELDGFLANPKTYAPGTKMIFKGIRDPAQRADLIAYLRSLSDLPSSAE